MEYRKSFEATYPQLPFARLVALGVGLAEVIGQHRRPRLSETLPAGAHLLNVAK